MGRSKKKSDDVDTEDSGLNLDDIPDEGSPPDISAMERLGELGRGRAPEFQEQDPATEALKEAFGEPAQSFGEFDCPIKGCTWKASETNKEGKPMVRKDKILAKNGHISNAHGMRPPKQKAAPGPSSGFIPLEEETGSPSPPPASRIAVDPDTIWKGDKADEAERRSRLVDALALFFRDPKKEHLKDMILSLWDKTASLRRMETGQTELYNVLIKLSGVNENTAQWIIKMTFAPEEQEMEPSGFQPMFQSRRGPREAFQPPQFQARRQYQPAQEMQYPHEEQTWQDREPVYARREFPRAERRPEPGLTLADVDRMLAERLTKIAEQNHVQQLERDNAELQRQVMLVSQNPPQPAGPSEEILELREMLAEERRLREDAQRKAEEQLRKSEAQRESDRIRHERELERRQWQEQQDEMLDKLDEVMRQSEQKISNLSRQMLQNQQNPAQENAVLQQIAMYRQEMADQRAAHAETLREIETDLELERADRARQEERKSYELDRTSLLEKIANIGSNTSSENIQMLQLQTGATQKMIETGMKEIKDFLRIYIDMNRPMGGGVAEEPPEVDPPRPSKGRRRLYPQAQESQYQQPPPQQYQPPPQQYQQPPQQYQQQQPQAQQPAQQRPSLLSQLRQQQQQQPQYEPPQAPEPQQQELPQEEQDPNGVPRFSRNRRRRRLQAASEDEIAALGGQVPLPQNGNGGGQLGAPAQQPQATQPSQDGSFNPPVAGPNAGQ